LKPLRGALARLQLPDAKGVHAMRDVMGSDIWINGGYFILRREFLDQLRPGEDLVEEPLQRLMSAGQVFAQRHEGFWAPMDTLKDQQWLESLHEDGSAPWKVWDPDRVARRELASTAAG
jgi:glucose-1-phosphate cytidylyltransferase